MLGKKHWAERIVSEAGVPSDTRVAPEIAEMLIAGARQFATVFAATPGFQPQDDLDLMVLSARAMPDNRSAVERLVEKFDLSKERATRLLELVRQAAYRIFEREGRKLPQVGRF